jgi:hypothetical protein
VPTKSTKIQVKAAVKKSSRRTTAQHIPIAYDIKMLEAVPTKPFSEPILMVYITVRPFDKAWRALRVS